VLSLAVARSAAYAQHVGRSLPGPRPTPGLAVDSAGGLRLRPIVNGIIVGAGIGALLGGVAGEARLWLEPGGDLGDVIITGALIGAGVGGIVGLVVALRSSGTRRRVTLVQIVVLPAAVAGHIRWTP
jgi:hypothetical protein